jgi:hypothetical protein
VSDRQTLRQCLQATFGWSVGSWYWSSARLAGGKELTYLWE